MPTHRNGRDIEESLGDVTDEAWDSIDSGRDCIVIAEGIHNLFSFLRDNAEEIADQRVAKRRDLARMVEGVIDRAKAQEELERCMGRPESLDFIEDVADGVVAEIQSGQEYMIRDVSAEMVERVERHFNYAPEPTTQEPGYDIRCASAPQDKDLEAELEQILSMYDGYPMNLTTTTDARGDLVGCVLLEEAVRD